MRRLGELLIQKGCITGAELEEALELQRSWHSKLGKVLVGRGLIKNRDLYQALAEQRRKEFVDLRKHRCDQDLLQPEHRDDYVRLGVIPWRKVKGKVVITATDLSGEAMEWIHKHYAQHYVVMTSPYDILWSVQHAFVAQDDEAARDALWYHDPQKSAKRLFFIPKQLGFLVLLALASIPVFYLKPFVIALFIILNLFFAATLIFKVVIFTVGYRAGKQQGALVDEGYKYLEDSELPMYTILVPLFKESAVTVEQLTSAIRNFDYPKSKLDVKLIVEHNDQQTVDAVKALACESYFEMIRVPYSAPQTKPKACNYALRFARGDYLTIYDAEDVPEPAQLKKVIWTFQNTPAKVQCVQAHLNYYNREENVLTCMFSLEYGAWFGFMLKGLQAMRLPIPLGGTSNHISLKVLRELYAWDPYNVTEDADLGIRLVQAGYSTHVVNSLTLEEAPVSIKSWINQRSRWIKGYMQTYIVHSRRPWQIFNRFGFRGFLGFLLFIGVPSVVFISIPIILVLSAIIYFGNYYFPSWFIDFAAMNFVVGIVSHVAFAYIVALKHKWPNMLIYSFIFPLYWILHSIASFKALWQLFVRPHYWEKTTHGLTKIRYGQTKTPA